jgi:hypothetical protein
MEYNKIQNELQNYVDFYSRSGADSIKWDEYGSLETIYKNNSLVIDLKDRASYLHTWMHNIGKEVYHSERSFNYALVDKFSEIDYLNQKYFNTSFSTYLTQEMFDELCVKYMEYQVKRLTEELLERSITSKSTCKMSNLVFEWNLECKQELIKIFKKLIEE